MSFLCSEKKRDTWSLDALTKSDPSLRVLVRAAPSPSFPVPNGDLLPLVVAALGPQAAPSLAAKMSLREAAERMQLGCSLAPLAYGSSSSPSSSPCSSFFSSFFSSSNSSNSSSSAPVVVSDGKEGGRKEWYYIQSAVPKEWIFPSSEEAEGEDEELESSPLSALLPLLLLSSDNGNSKTTTATTPATPARTRTTTDGISQDFRLWLSAPNAVSPLHWDTSRSALAVLRGTKTFHFWDPAATFSRGMDPREERWRLLRRRCAADPSDRLGCCPPATVRAVVREGDAVAFPPFWSHHVLSHNDDDNAGQKTGRPILALTRRASPSPSSSSSRQRQRQQQQLWKGAGVVGAGVVRSGCVL